MKQTYLFESDIFGFKLITQDDIQYLIKLDGDSEIMTYFPGGARSHQEIQTNIKKYIRAYEKGLGNFLVFNIVSGEFIGRAGFGEVENGEIEVGYLLLKKHWGKGLASRILISLLNWARSNIKKDKIIALTPLNHLSSERVMQKAGMIFSHKGIMKGVECVVYEYRLNPK